MNIFGLNIELASSKNGIVEVNQNVSDLWDEVGQPYFINCSTVQGRSTAYKQCDVVRTVIGKSSSAIANLKVWALDDAGKQVNTVKSRKILSKLQRPNPKEDFKRFFRKLDLYCKLHGKAYVHMVYSNLFDEYNYYVIPNEFVTEYYLNETDELYNRKVDKYIINDHTQTYEILPQDIHIFYDGTLNEHLPYESIGGSRLESLSEVISTYIVLWEVLTGMYGDRGALNIVSMGINNPQMASLGALKSEKESILKRLSETYGVRRGQSKTVVVSTDAKVSPLTAKMSDMEFANIIIECKKAIANAFDCPAVLLDVESARYKNTTEAIKVLYTQSAIPTAEYYFSEWLQMTGEIALPFKLMADYSHLEFYQEAQKEEAIAFQQMSNAIATLANVVLDKKTVITNEEARIKLDLI
jgi:hypothetical protein